MAVTYTYTDPVSDSNRSIEVTYTNGTKTKVYAYKAIYHNGTFSKVDTEEILDFTAEALQSNW
jgi:intein-encoded DNA endonuclease-like protein